ncbi:MAG: hypothetical protein V3V10_05505 [Planctomycetota bacterium]
MSQPDIPVANRALNRPEMGIALTLNVTDPEVVAELNSREGLERDKYASTALRVGVLALRSAGGVVDADKLKSEGERLIHEVEKRLTAHSTKLDKALDSELKSYFDPESGHFQKHVSDLVSEDGKLVRMLKSHVEGDKSVLARQLAAAVGENSPLMTYLDPKQTDGLIQIITSVAEERLEEQSKKVLKEFDVSDDDSALSKLIEKINTNFDVEDDKSALYLINKALEKTREQIRKDLSLDEDGSALKNLHGQLKAQIDKLANEQVDFQKKLATDVANVMGELRGAKKERDKSPSGGFDFEHFVSDAIRQRIPNTDLFDDTGEAVGQIKASKVGDHVQILGEDSIAPGVRIVYESKRAENYSLAKALAELEIAKKNRDAKIGVFILAASSVRNSKKMQAEFDSTLQRHGSNIVVIWDQEDEASNVNLDAAVTLARALVVQEAKPAEEASKANWENINKAINSIERQFEYFSEMGNWSDNVIRDGKKIKDRMGKMQEALNNELEKLTNELDALK